MTEIQKKSDPHVAAGTHSGTPELVHKKKSLLGQYAFILLFACCMAFVFLTPQDVLQRYPQVVPYVDWMASWHPHVHTLGLRHVSGPLAEAHSFCAAVIWGVWTALLFPLLVVWFVRDEPAKPFTSVREVLFGLIAFPLLALLTFYQPEALYSRIGRSLVTNLSARPFGIPLAAVVCWCSVCGTFIFWRSAFRRNFDF